jgi:hypothetical protein
MLASTANVTAARPHLPRTPYLGRESRDRRTRTLTRRRCDICMDEESAVPVRICRVQFEWVTFLNKLDFRIAARRFVILLMIGGRRMLVVDALRRYRLMRCASVPVRLPSQISRRGGPRSMFDASRPTCDMSSVFGQSLLYSQFPAFLSMRHLRSSIYHGLSRYI